MRARAGLLAVLLVVGAAWLATLSPGVRIDNDAGALQAVCATFGVAHPTGFPLYTLACGAFVRMAPLGDLAWRANLFSAVCGLGALVPLFAVLRRVGAGPALAAAGAAAFAALPVMWRVAVAAEVYTLHLLLAGAAWALVLRWRDDRDPRALWLAVFAACLGVGVHPLMALTAPGLLMTVVWTDRAAALRAVPMGTVALAAGLLPHAWLWARVQDPETPLRYLHGADVPTFLAYATGAQFRGEMLAGPDLAVLWREAGLQTLLAAAAAVFLRAVPDRPTRAGLLLAIALHTAFAVTYGIGEVGPYMLPVAWLGVVGSVAMASRRPWGAWALVPVAVAMLAVNHRAARQDLARQDAATVVAIAAEADVVFVRHWPWLGAMWAQQLATAGGGPAVVPWGWDAPPLTPERLRARLDGDLAPHQPGALPADGAVLLVGPGWDDASVACVPLGEDACRVSAGSPPPAGGPPGTR